MKNDINSKFNCDRFKSWKLQGFYNYLFADSIFFLTLNNNQDKIIPLQLEIRPVAIGKL